MNAMSKKITGSSLAKTGFRLHETTGSVDVESVFEVLSGNLAAYRIRNYLSSEACDKIAKNFWSSEKKTPRYGEGENGVEGYLIGASHIEKTTHEYLTEAQAFKDAVENLYAETINPIANFRNQLITNNNEYGSLRPAELNGFVAGDSKAVSWNNVGDFLLLPHEDLAQTKDPRQKDFEIQETTRVMAVNFYAQVQENAGQLKLWNIEPDQQSRETLGLTYSGYPYPPDILTHFESMIISVEAGDLCVINGNLIHAVLQGNPTTTSKERLLITCFMTSNNKKELIWWT